MTTEPAPEGRAGRRRVLITGAVLSVGAVCTLLILSRYVSAEFSSRAAVLAILAAQPVALLAIWFPALRLASLAGAPATSSASFYSNALSIVFSLVTPGRIFEAAKPVGLNLLTGLPLARGFVAVAFERILDVGCLVILAVLVLGSAVSRSGGGLQEAAVALTALFAAGAVGIAALALWQERARDLATRLPVDWLRRAVLEMMDAIARLGNWSNLATAAFYSALTWATSYLTFFVLLKTVGMIPLSAAQVLFVLVAGTLGYVVTVTPGGLGTYEGAVALALTGFGYPLADAVALAVLLRIAVFLPAVAASAWFLTRSGFSIADFAARLRRGRDEP